MAVRANLKSQLDNIDVVEKDGSISNVKFLQQTNSILDKEVLRVVKMMPKWKPGTENGKVCRSVVSIPFVFSL